MPYVSWTKPIRFDHPRIWARQQNLAALQARAAGSHSGSWAKMQSWINGKMNSTNYPSSYFFSREAEWAAAFAFSYMLKPTVATNIAHGRRGIDIAIDYAAQSIPTGFTRREYALVMALTYTWCFPLLTDAQRSALRARISDYTLILHNPNESDFIWGTGHGDLCKSAIAQITILEDGSSTENATWANRMQTMLDKFDNGTNTGCYFPAFRHFGNVDGGTHKGAGPFGYSVRNEEFYARALPALQTIGVDWHGAETWWTQGLKWHLWHLRGDRTFHRQGENEAFGKYHINTQIHAYQVATNHPDSYGEACQWLAATEIPAVDDSTIWGPYYLHDILWHDLSRSPIAPTIDNQGGLQMRVFSNTGKVCLRSGFGASDTSMTVEVPRYFLGGHSKNAHGAFELARSKPLFVSHGHYDPNQSKSYKEVGSATVTGHRDTYCRSTVCRNVTRILDSNEPAENVMESFQRQASPNSRFGIWNGSSVDVKNVGGQLWPKRSPPNGHQPEDLAALLAEPKWNFDGFLIPPVETTKYCYLAIDLTERYYAPKCTKYHRHILWVKRGAIPGWNEPVILIFDDLVTHVDSVGKFTQVFQLQTQNQMTGTAAALQLDNAPDRCFVRTVYPAVEVAHVSGFKDLNGNVYPATEVSGHDDSIQGVWRAELNPASSGGTQKFLVAMFPCAAGVSAAPTGVGIDDASWIGETIGGIDCKISKTATYQASVGTSADTTPPAVPGAPTVAARSNAVETSWSNPGESDCHHVELWRRAKN